MHFCTIYFFTMLYIFCFFGCAQNLEKNMQNRVSLGRIDSIKMSQLYPQAKPKKEIARICVASLPFHSSKQYEILTLENLIKEARKKRGVSWFHNVSVWQYSSNMLVWQKKCLILGE